MNISDFFIIYLACGAPCGVYFFLQNRKKLNRQNLWLKSFLTVFVWIPYAFILLHDFATKRKLARRSREKSAFEKKLFELQKQLSQFHFNAAAGHSLFELREVLERYCGLTLALSSSDKTPNSAESELFRIALRENAQIAAECLRRRNRLRLKFHQNSARRDFLKLISELKISVAAPERLKAGAIELVEILNDAKAAAQLKEIFGSDLQIGDNFIVKNLEKEVWNSKETKPRPASPLPMRLKAFTATTTKKD